MKLLESIYVSLNKKDVLINMLNIQTISVANVLIIYFIHSSFSKAINKLAEELNVSPWKHVQLITVCYWDFIVIYNVRWVHIKLQKLGAHLVILPVVISLKQLIQKKTLIKKQS